MKKLLTLAGFVFCIALFLLVYSASAQEQNAPRLDLTVSPPVIELTAKPGEKIKEKFRVRNNLSEQVALEVSARKLISDPQSGTPIPDTSTQGEELSWVSFEQQSFISMPKEWKDINFTIDIPSNAAFGYYYVFRVGLKNDDTSLKQGAKLKGELLVVVLLNVKREGTISKAELTNFSTKKFISEYLPVEFEVTLANKGNVHVKPRGNIFIRSGNQKDIAILDVNQGMGSILPSGTRKFEASWADGFLVNEPVIEDGITKIKDGKPLTKLAINWNKLTSFRIGPYTASLLMVYDDGKRDQAIEGTTTFWVIPYTAIAVMVVGLIIFFVVLRFILKWYIRREVTRGRR